MSDKVFDAKELATPFVEKLAFTAGKFFGSSGWLGSKVDDLPEVLRAAAPGITLLATGGLGIPRRWIPIPGAPGDLIHKYVNDAFDSFGHGLSDGLNSLKDMTPEQIGEAMQKASETALNKTIWLALRMLHSNENCTVLAEYRNDTGVPARKDKQTGKDIPASSRAKILKTDLAQGLRESIPLCPVCNPANVQGAPTASPADKAKPANKKASPAEICGQYVLEAQDDEERQKRSARVKRLRQMRTNVMDPELSDRFDGLNTRAELETLLQAADDGDQKAFEDELLHLEEPGPGRELKRHLGKAKAAIAKKLDEINAACEPARASVRLDLEEAKRKRDARKGRSAADAANPPGRTKRVLRWLGQLFADLFSSPV